MGTLNEVNLIGRLGADPEAFDLKSGDRGANFSVATQDGKEAPTEWHRCVAFAERAETILKYVRKGDLVYVSGSLRTRKYEDREGIERYSTQVTVWKVVLLGNQKDKPTEDNGRQDNRKPVKAREKDRAEGRQSRKSHQKVVDTVADHDDDGEDVPF